MSTSSRQNRIPTYRLHKPSGQAVVTLDGRDIYLGPHGCEESRADYNRLIAEWIANGRRLASGDEASLTVAEVITRYWRHAEGYYRKNGKPTSELHCLRVAFRPLRRLCGHTPAKDFGPLALKAVRQVMIDNDWTRETVNGAVSRIKRMMKWAAENELVTPGIYHGLAAVSGLRAGRSEARESKSVEPVPDAHVDAIKPFVSRQVWAIVELQRLTGMRPGEVAVIRGCDLDTTGRVWTYMPASHKTAHHGRPRVIYIGPRAQVVLEPFLKRDLGAYLFSPIDAEQERHAELRCNRKSPVQPSQLSRAEWRRRRAECGRRRRSPREQYRTASYCRAIRRACERAGVPPWHPHQLRHTAATRLRKEYGLDAARVILGHKSLAMTEIYAEIDAARAVEIMERVG